MAQLGDMLRAAREGQGLSLDDVESNTHIRRHLLEALEQNTFEAFPSPVVARGLIRNYATFLGLDPTEALTLFDGRGVMPVKGQRVTPYGTQFSNLATAPRPIITFDLLIGLLIFLLIVGGTAYGLYELSRQVDGLAFIPPTPTLVTSETVAESALVLPTVTPLPTSTPTPLPPTPTPTAVVYSGVTVELVIQQPSWVQIQVDSVQAFEGILQPGDNRQWTGAQRVEIRAGNAGGIEVVVNGVNRGLMGAEGRVAEQIWEKVEDSAILTPEPTVTPEGSS